MFSIFKKKTITLEEQIETLASYGLRLNDGITIDDLLYSFEREEYESKPYDLIMFMYGSEVEREPWGRPFCSKVWNCDMERIEGNGSYVEIVKRLCEVAGMPSLIADVEDFVDIDNNKAWLKYTVDGRKKERTVPINDDWADAGTITEILSDIERDGNRFYTIDNGQASIFFYLEPNVAKKLNKVIGNRLQ